MKNINDEFFIRMKPLTILMMVVGLGIYGIPTIILMIIRPLRLDMWWFYLWGISFGVIPILYWIRTLKAIKRSKK